MSEKPWTWEELRRIERARGERFLAFLQTYGVVGALALELTRTKLDERRWGKGARPCAMGAVPGRPGCFACPLERETCSPWLEEGRRNLARVYERRLRLSPFMPKGR